MAYATVTLTGTYQQFDGTPAKGHVRIFPSVNVVKDTTGNVILTNRHLEIPLDAQGSFSVALPATDDPTLNPTGFGYTIAARLDHHHPKAFSFDLPAALGATTVEDLTPVDPATFEPTATYAESSELDALAATIPTTAADIGALPDTTVVPDDTSVAGWVNDPASQTRDALDGTYVGRSKIAKTLAQNVEIWGHSYTFGIGASDRAKGLGYIAAHGLGLPVREEGVSGASLTSAPSGGSYVKVLQFVKPRSLGLPDGSGVPATADRGFTGPGGVYACMWGINDINELGGLGDQLEAYRDALRTVVSRMRAGVVFEDDDPSFAFNGSWSTHAVTDRNSGTSYKYAIANDRSYSITTPADFPGGTVAIGIHSASPLGGGATHTATVNGQDYTLDAHQRRSGGTGYTHTLRIPNVPAGVQTINVALGPVTTLTGVDFWQWEAGGEDAPLVVLCKQPYCPDYSAYGAGGTFGPPTDARVDDLNSIIDDIAAEFGERVVVVDLSALNRDASMFAADKLHPSDKGHRAIGEAIVAAVKAAGYSVQAGGTQGPRVDYGTAAPTSNRQGWYPGDTILNSTPTVLGTAGSQYTIHSWVCTVAGRPGTWVERRMPTGT